MLTVTQHRKGLLGSNHSQPATCMCKAINTQRKHSEKQTVKQTSSEFVSGHCLTCLEKTMLDIILDGPESNVMMYTHCYGVDTLFECHTKQSYGRHVVHIVVHNCPSHIIHMQDTL